MDAANCGQQSNLLAQAFAEELLGDSIEELGSFDEKDLATVLEGAS